MNVNSECSLRLERHFFTLIQCKTLPEREKGAALKIATKVELGRHQDDERRFEVKLAVVFGPGGKVGYEGNIEIVGYFQVNPSYPKGKAQSLVQTHGSSLLYAAVREMICNLTSRGPWPMVRLDFMPFQFTLDKVKQSKTDGKSLHSAPRRVKK